MKYVSFLRFTLPHLDAKLITFRVGVFSTDLWVGFTAVGEDDEAAQLVGLVVGLSEASVLRRAQKVYRRWYLRTHPSTTR